VLSRCLAEERQAALHPPIHGALVDQDAALSQAFADFGIAQAVAHLPAHGHGADVLSNDPAGQGRARSPREASPAVSAAEALAAEWRGAIPGDSIRLAARARHRGVLLHVSLPGPTSL
jgi:hypothetical protein